MLPRPVPNPEAAARGTRTIYSSLYFDLFMLTSQMDGQEPFQTISVSQERARLSARPHCSMEKERIAIWRDSFQLEKVSLWCIVLLPHRQRRPCLGWALRAKGAIAGAAQKPVWRNSHLRQRL